MTESSTRFRRTRLATPVVFVHGTGGSGHDMRAYVEAYLTAAEATATEAGATLFADCVLLFPSFQTPYQFLLPAADRDLIALIDELAADGICAPRMVIVGHSGGAQFAHRFALAHPQRVHTALCLAAGCWTNPQGVSHGMMVEEGWFTQAPWDSPAIAEACRRPAAAGYQAVSWVVGCGTEDKRSRHESALRFYTEVKDKDGDAAKYFGYAGGHELPAGQATTDFFAILQRRLALARQDAQTANG